MKKLILSLVKITFLIVLVFGAGFGAGFYHQKTIVIDRAIEVLTPEKSCYEIQDIEIIIFGEPQT